MSKIAVLTPIWTSLLTCDEVILGIIQALNSLLSPPGKPNLSHLPSRCLRGPARVRVTACGRAAPARTHQPISSTPEHRTSHILPRNRDQSALLIPQFSQSPSRPVSWDPPSPDPLMCASRHCWTFQLHPFWTDCDSDFSAFFSWAAS